MMKKRGFSLIEVLFAVAFLMMIGVGMTTLNAAASRLIAIAEIKTIALALNEQAAAYMSLAKKTNSAAFGDQFSDCYGTGCYLLCPNNVSEDCGVIESRRAFQVGNSKLQFAIFMNVRAIDLSSSSELLTVTSSWGQGSSRQLRTVHILEP